MVHERLPALLTNVALLGDSLTFQCGRTAVNRLLKAALTERISTYDAANVRKCGIPTDKIINMYEKWGNGGFGVILTGNVVVDPFNLESAGNAIISKENDSEELRKAFSRWASVSKADGALAIVQLSHAGRQTPVTVNAHPFSASDVQLKEKRRFTGFGVPIPLTLEQIKTEVIDRFVFAAKFAKDVEVIGFDGVQLHGAHGYLLSQFMSPTTNKRTDDYGGSAENRIRIVLDIHKAIRDEIPSSTGFVVSIKMNSVEFQDQGLQTSDARTMCSLLESAGFDFVELSGGTIEKLAFHHMRDSTRDREAFFLEFTDMLRDVFVKSVVYVTGGFRTAAGMVAAIEKGSTQGIGLGRPITAEPDLPLKLLSGEALAAAATKLNADDFGVTNLASNSQMFAMGRRPLKELNGNILGDVPDLSHPEEAKLYQQGIAGYTQHMKKLAEAGQPIHGVYEYTRKFEV